MQKWCCEHVFFLCAVHKKRKKHRKKSLHLVTQFVLFLLSFPKKAILKRGPFRTAPLEWSFCTRKQKKTPKTHHVRFISPLQSHPANRHPQFSLKGSRRALSSKERKNNSSFHTRHISSVVCLAQTRNNYSGFWMTSF